MSEIAADTAALRRQVFAAYIDHMKQTKDTFLSGVAANNPVVPTVRGDTDAQVVKLLKECVPQVETVLTALGGVVTGNQDTIKLVADMFDAIEAENVDSVKAVDVDPKVKT